MNLVAAVLVILGGARAWSEPTPLMLSSFQKLPPTFFMPDGRSLPSFMPERRSGGIHIKVQATGIRNTHSVIERFESGVLVETIEIAPSPKDKDCRKC